MTMLSDRLVEARGALEANAQCLAEARDRLMQTRQELAAGRARRQQLHDLSIARLVAQLETMPVIEQAKGILMAQSGCGPEEAFDMLRRASQRSNVKVSELAAKIVERTSRGDPPDASPRPRPPAGRPAAPGVARPVTRGSPPGHRRRMRRGCYPAPSPADNSAGSVSLSVPGAGA